MNYFREKVSGNKKRYVDKEFDLDLSYITPRLIAMAIPGEGMKKLYRNNINDVKSFLEKKHYNQCKNSTSKTHCSKDSIIFTQLKYKII